MYRIRSKNYIEVICLEITGFSSTAVYILRPIKSMILLAYQILIDSSAYVGKRLDRLQARDFLHDIKLLIL